MIQSIRKFLLVNLLMAITITTSLAAIGNYYLNQQDIKRHLDSLLVEFALVFEALLEQGLHENNVEALQASMQGAELGLRPELLKHVRKEYPNYHSSNKYHFQVWNQEGKLLLHSTGGGPHEILAQSQVGFSNKYVQGLPWRVFSSYNNKLGLKIIVAESYDTRNELSYQITHDDIYILLFTYLLAGVLIWAIIGKGLSSLKRVASEVAHRAPTYLEPVNVEAVPVEIKALVEELNRLFLRLQLAFEREKRFAGDAAHELRTPLAALKTQAQVVLNTNNEQERLAILNNIINGVDRCAHVVQQLLTLSQLVPEATMLADSVPTNLAKVTADTIAQLVPIALNKNIEIALSAPEIVLILGNSTALSILIYNLVDNAIRYTPAGGFVQVHIDTLAAEVVVRIIDSGPGIPAELRSRVFERFFRVLGTKVAGSGLGLAIVQQIALLHNAKVRLGSPVSGKGLEVSVVFPLLRE